MGSLINGIPPVHHNESVVNTGHSIDIKNYKSDALVVERAADSNSDLLAKLEATIRANNPIGWFDSSDLDTITEENGRVTEWRHKLGGTVKAEASGAFSGRGPVRTSTMLEFPSDVAGYGLSLGEQLDSYLVGVNATQWTICASVYSSEHEGDYNIGIILAKIGSTGSNWSIQMGITDYADAEEPYTVPEANIWVANSGTSSNGFFQSQRAVAHREHIMIATFDSRIPGAGKLELRTNSNGETYNTNTVGLPYILIKDTKWPLTIGGSLLSIAQGFESINGIHEIIIFSEAISDDLKDKVEKYLAIKRGLTKYLESHRPHD